MRIENRVKTTLQGGGVTVGVFIQMPSPDIVELAALAGFDFALLDGEHGRISPDDAYSMILAGEARDIDVMARIGQNDRQVILKYLDLGVSGVMIPQTHNPETAQRALDALRYWPRGGRGLAGGRTFDYAVGAPMAERVPAINERVLSIIQFEHIDALPHLDELLALPELDVLFVGPTDLAQSMGYPGQPGHPDVEQVIAQVCERARGSRVALGTVAGDAELSNRRIAQGFRMIVANVPALLLRSSRALLDGIQRDGASGSAAG
ncbi:MAG TPA: aldolase/citrate lyase family protein [Thermomicrobiales bacterium]|nr:aldolase/citrate lyase family protein [Thermomicrobiales bacterium]